MKKLNRIQRGLFQFHEALVDERTRVERITDALVAEMRLLINDNLTVAESFEFVADLDDCTDRFERLSLCRIYAGRYVYEDDTDDYRCGLCHRRECSH